MIDNVVEKFEKCNHDCENGFGKTGNSRIDVFVRDYTKPLYMMVRLRSRRIKFSSRWLVR